MNKDSLKTIVQEYTRLSETIWLKHSHSVNITKCSKEWWNKECWDSLTDYRSSKTIKDWRTFKGVVKKTKYLFFNNKIQEIASKNHWPWDLMNWVKKFKLPAMEALIFNGQLCIEINNLWQVLHQTFNLAQNYQVNLNLLDGFPLEQTCEWPPFSKKELKASLSNTTIHPLLNWIVTI